jgi:hypothetical protein
VTLEWLPASGTWLSGYTGLDQYQNPLTEEIIKRDGALDKESLKAYGKIGGTLAGAGACTALGVTAPVAGGCGYIGGLIGEYLASLVPYAAGSTPADLETENWKQYAKPYLQIVQKTTLAGISYLTLRDALITQSAAPKEWADKWLTDHGLPGAPLQERWLPRADRWSLHSKWLTGLITPADFDGVCGGAKDAGIGMPCRDWYFLTRGGCPPVSKPGDMIDWGLLAAEAFWASRGHPKGGYFVWKPPQPGTPLDLPEPPKAFFPVSWLEGRLASLKFYREELLKTAKVVASVEQVAQTQSAAKKASPVKTILIAGTALAAAAGGFYLWKKR